jgi:hypothetical protein
MTFMKRFSTVELQQIKALVEKGASLQEFSAQTGHPKSAVQYHVAKERGKKNKRKTAAGR